MIYLFSDGACSGNPGPGGWGCILTDYQRVRELCGFERASTNNRMELMGVLAGLSQIKSKKSPVKIFSDSVYVLKGSSLWLNGWKSKNWVTASGEPVANRKLWEDLDDMINRWQGRLEWHYVRGHIGIPANERCDEMAVMASQEQAVDTYDGDIANYPIDLRQLPEDTSLPESQGRKTRSEVSHYLSLARGELIRHRDWKSCEARVKGVSGAKYKKIKNKSEENLCLKEWGRIESDIIDES